MVSIFLFIIFVLCLNAVMYLLNISIYIMSYIMTYC